MIVDDKLHFPTCKVWETNDVGRCNCVPKDAWRILKDEKQQFPWRVFRCTSDGHLEELMGCSSQDGAEQLVQGFQWLRDNSRQLRGKNV